MKKILCVLFILSPAILFSQEKTIEISWQETDSVCYFPYASYENYAGHLPIYTELIPWKGKKSLPRVQLRDYDSEILDPKFHHQIARSGLDSEPLLSSKLVFRNKEAMLQLTFQPFYHNKEGQIERISSFNLLIDSIPKIAYLKSERKGNFASSSFLASGEWYKIAISETGIHKVSYEDLIELGVSNPATVKIFGAGAIYLPEDYSRGSYDDLEEIPVYVEKGSDQLFGPGDYYLFYASGPVSWSYDRSRLFYSQSLHPYSNFGYYFICDHLGAATSPAKTTLIEEEATHFATQYDLLAYYEEENDNLLSSGRQWFSDHLKLSLTKDVPFNLEGLDLSKEMKIKVSAAGRSNETSYMQITANGSTLGNLSFDPVNLSSYTSTIAKIDSEIFNYFPENEIVTIQTAYLLPNSNSEAWLDNITINGRADLDFKENELLFRNSWTVSDSNITEFTISDVKAGLEIWDISAPDQPLSVRYSSVGGNAVFKYPTSVLKEFVAFDPRGSFPSPQYSGKNLGLILNQDLHGSLPPDLIIIYPELFEEEVNRLAEHRRDKDGLEVLCVIQEQIFNEFSSGTPNIAAIRNYLKMYYDNVDAEDMTPYLLLFGDGSFDNRDTGVHNPNLILTYQSPNSTVPTSSFVSDDFFGLLDTGESIYDGLLDIGIGRLPVSTAEEAELLVDKIIAYDDNSTLGEWRNYICLIGDDEDGNVHMSQANELANYIEENHPNYNVNKIFMDAYPQETTPTGDRYPDVTRAINDQINRGALIINYTGHGGVTGLAHEKIIDLTTIKAWSNKGKYPLFLTATCEFSRYDEYDPGKESEITSAGEEVLLNADGGSIALFTTTRLVYSGPNHTLNEHFYNIVFEKKPDGSSYRLGDIIKYSKNKTGAGVNKRNFTLLGDPSICLSFPGFLVKTDSINHMPADQVTDTLAALDFVTVSGHVEDLAGNLMDTLNGVVIPIVYDKMKKLKTLANDGGSTKEFLIRNSILYKGNASLKNGYFSFSFYVPKDIGYNVGGGKISYYAYTDHFDAHGSNENLTIGGLGDFTDLDTVGPEIKLFMNDSLFRNGGIVDPSPELLVYVSDPYGVNTTGNGIGHDITATLDEDRFDAIILNEYYVSDIDSYSSGTIRYPYSKLSSGKHSIDVKVWDIFNNSETKTIDFVVVESAEMLLKEIYNYPNPFSDNTFFNIEHNRPDNNLDVIIRIYNLQGNLVTVLQNKVYSSGYRVDPVNWNGSTMGGAQLGGGIYLYKILVVTEEGEQAMDSGRLIIKR